MTIPIAAIQLYSTEKYDGDVFFTIVSVVIACIWNAIASRYVARSHVVIWITDVDKRDIEL